MRKRPGVLVVSTLAAIGVLVVGGCSSDSPTEGAETVANVRAGTGEPQAEREDDDDGEEQEGGEASAAALAAEAAVTEARARASALARVPGGEIAEGELERENGKLVYSFDIKVPGKPGIEEIQIDALTGTVISQVHETPDDEAAEAAKDAAKAKPAGTN